MDYWYEAVEIALNDAGVSASDEQIDLIAGAIKVSHANYSMCHFTPSSNNESEEVSRLQKELDDEKSKVVCPNCKGAGFHVVFYGTRSAEFECHKCRGSGRVLP